jgi:predicted O-linked N-acetylglucosamine transferase (SPINDLY family)
LSADSAQHWLELGQSLRAQQRWTEAADAFRQAIARDANHATAWFLLGMSEVNANHYDEAEQAYERSLALAPGSVEPLTCYAFLLNQRGKPQRAMELLRDVLARAGHLSVAWLVLGQSCELLGDLESAETAARKAVELAPQDPSARYQLANVLLFRWREPTKALEQTQHLLALYPNHADAWALQGLILRALGRHDESLGALRRSVQLASTPQNHSKLLADLQYFPGITAEALLQAHREWNAAHTPQARPAPPSEPRTPSSSLRLGFLSGDFGQHPAAFLVLPALEHLDRQQCSIICYADRVIEDAYTARFRAIADRWQTTIGMPHDDLANLIRRENIDILFDMSGHFGERMLLFAKKPGPIQITWFGYVGTTGLSTMDYVLADAHHICPGEERWYTESVLRMPHDYACYQAPPDAPDVTPLPALTNGYVTFGCFSNPAKFNPPLFDVWAEILRRVPSARLFLKFGWIDDSALQEQLRGELERRGISRERLLLEGHSPQRELMASYGRVDLALDTQPYSGGLTTCEALWMGVPVITYAGQTFAGRHSVSHLTNAGFPQFIAPNQAAYIELAAEWADRLSELASIRAQMRDQVRRSPLCDAPRFAADLLTLLTSLKPR